LVGLIALSYVGHVAIASLCNGAAMVVASLHTSCVVHVALLKYCGEMAAGSVLTLVCKVVITNLVDVG
jgi:hypothetical protein